MTTIINNPNNVESTGVGVIIGAVLVVAIALGLFYYYGPLRKNPAETPASSIKVDVNLPTPKNNNQ